MSIEIKKKLKKERSRSYLVKDFSSFRAELLSYAKTYFPEQIQDFSEASLGGLFLDMASFVGDNLSYYLDYQFNELNWATAIETENIRQHLVNAGVEVVGASPAVVNVEFFIQVPAELYNNDYREKRAALPVIQRGTTLLAEDGPTFNLTEDMDFTQVGADGVLIANSTATAFTAAGAPTQYILSLVGLCISGTETVETFFISNTHVPFRTITLANESATEIISVSDTSGNTYYEVESLSQDIIYKGIINRSEDNELVQENMELVPAPYRFMKRMDPRTRMMTLRFGGGNADSLDDDIIPDPSELSLPLYGKKTFSRFSIDPNALLNSHTLGIAPKNTTMRVHYRYGGGLTHNVGSGTIRSINILQIHFPGAVTLADANSIRATLDVKNSEIAAGGDEAPSIDSLRAQIPMARQMQSRIVSKQDLLARIYTLPSRFGRVYRAGIRNNPDNPMAIRLYILSRNADRKLVTSPDSLKKNLRLYINQLRLISDAIDVLDARIVNFAIKFAIVSHPDTNKNMVVQAVIARIQSVVKIENFQIDQPIMLADLINVIINTTDVVALVELKIRNVTTFVDGRSYSDVSIDVDASTFRGLVIPPAGGIFELKYPLYDIIGTSA
jgi:hypothetical protein